MATAKVEAGKKTGQQDGSRRLTGKPQGEDMIGQAIETFRMYFGKGSGDGVPIRGGFRVETVKGTVRVLGPHTGEMSGSLYSYIKFDTAESRELMLEKVGRAIRSRRNWSPAYPGHSMSAPEAGRSWLRSKPTVDAGATTSARSSSRCASKNGTSCS